MGIINITCKLVLFHKVQILKNAIYGISKMFYLGYTLMSYLEVQIK